jgi:hypothetical protein
MMNSPSWWKITMTALICILKLFRMVAPWHGTTTRKGLRAAHRLRKKKTDSNSSRLSTSHLMLPTMATRLKNATFSDVRSMVASLKSDKEKKELGILVGHDRNQRKYCWAVNLAKPHVMMFVSRRTFPLNAICHAPPLPQPAWICPRSVGAFSPLPVDST